MSLADGGFGSVSFHGAIYGRDDRDGTKLALITNLLNAVWQDII